MKASQVEAVGRLVDNALDTVERVRNLASAPAPATAPAAPAAAPAPAAPAPEAQTPHAEPLAAILEDRLAALWKVFTAAEARVRELEAALAARAAAATPAVAPVPVVSERAVVAETLLAEMRQRVALLELRLAESEGRRHELERLNAAQRGQLDDLLRRMGALEAQATGGAGTRVVRVPVLEPE